MMNALKRVVRARWFPTVTKPIAIGATASAVLVGLQALGIAAVPDTVVAAVTPFVGFLVTAVSQKTPEVETTTDGEQKPTVGQALGPVFSKVIAESIDSDPDATSRLMLQALQNVLHGSQAPVHPATTQEVVNTGNPS